MRNKKIIAKKVSKNIEERRKKIWALVAADSTIDFI